MRLPCRSDQRAGAHTPSEAAERLGIHPNTLSYRIHRIETLLGGSLLSGEFCFRVQLALKLLPISRFGRAL